VCPSGKAYQVNVTSSEAVEAAINGIVSEFNGRLDVFVANSGIAWEDGPFIDGPVETAKKVMTVNVDGVMWCAKTAGAHFRRQKKEGTTIDGKPLENFVAGSFIATASMSGSIVNIPQLQAVYNGSKAAVIHFCKSCAPFAMFDGGIRWLTRNLPAQARAWPSSGQDSPA
jgi:sorbose reductase